MSSPSSAGYQRLSAATRRRADCRRLPQIKVGHGFPFPRHYQTQIINPRPRCRPRCYLRPSWPCSAFTSLPSLPSPLFPLRSLPLYPSLCLPCTIFPPSPPSLSPDPHLVALPAFVYAVCVVPLKAFQRAPLSGLETCPSVEYGCPGLDCFTYKLKVKVGLKSKRKTSAWLQ